MASSMKFQVTGSPDQIRPLLEQTLQPEGFQLTWLNPAEGIIEKGNSNKAIFLGLFSLYYQFGILLRTQPDGSTIVEMEHVNAGLSGITGGAIGVVKVRRKFTQIGQLVQTTFQANGTLITSST